MSEELMNFVRSLRANIYIAGILIVVYISTISFINISTERQMFWPPDMIPHPNPPWEQPTDPREPVLAEKRSYMSAIFR